MADEGNIISDLGIGQQPGNGADNQPTAGVVAQYIKDLSVENPNAPACFNWQEAPQVDIQFNIAATPIDGELQEVALKIEASAKADSGVLYAVELTYCGLVVMRNLEDGQAHAFLYAEAPRIIFPFARRVIADATRDAGFAPLMLDPVDFNGLYMQQLAASQQQGEGEAPGAPTGEA